MKKILTYMSALALGMSFIQCSDFLETPSPGKTNDEFVTSTEDETFKTLSWCYANYRQNCAMGVYLWNDPVGSDVESYPEQGSANNLNARLQPEQLSINASSG